MKCEDGEKISGVVFFGPRKKGVADHVILFSNLFWAFLPSILVEEAGTVVQECPSFPAELRKAAERSVFEKIAAAKVM